MRLESIDGGRIDRVNQKKYFRGLGLLSDGYVAETSPFDEANRNGSWIGWSRAHSGKPFRRVSRDADGGLPYRWHGDAALRV